MVPHVHCGVLWYHTCTAGRLRVEQYKQGGKGTVIDNTKERETFETCKLTGLQDNVVSLRQAGRYFQLLYSRLSLLIPFTRGYCS